MALRVRSDSAGYALDMLGHAQEMRSDGAGYARDVRSAGARWDLGKRSDALGRSWVGAGQELCTFQRCPSTSERHAGRPTGRAGARRRPDSVRV